MFKTREEAGLLLAQKLKTLPNLANAFAQNTIVIAVPRGGVVVGNAVAKSLGLRFSAVIIKKIGAPDNPELALGAIGSANTVFWDEEIIKSLGVDEKTRQELKVQKELEVKEREEFLKINHANLKGAYAIIVDDGVATGATAITAAMVVKNLGAKKIILATPVISKETIIKVKKYFDEIVFIENPVSFYAVGEFYNDFPQVDDDEVKKMLKV